jgi:hypothetical protein
MCGGSLVFGGDDGCCYVCLTDAGLASSSTYHISPNIRFFFFFQIQLGRKEGSLYFRARRNKREGDDYKECNC